MYRPCDSITVNEHSALLGRVELRQDSTIPHRDVITTVIVSKGYKDVVIHVSLLEVVHNGVLIDLAEQHHVIHSAVFDIVALPVVPVVPPAPLQQNTYNVQLLFRSGQHNETPCQKDATRMRQTTPSLSALSVAVVLSHRFKTTGKKKSTCKKLCMCIFWSQLHGEPCLRFKECMVRFPEMLCVIYPC